MTSYERIIDSFNTDEPIFVDDIKVIFPDKSRPWIDKTLKAMVESESMKRFDQGVYYIPRKTAFGDSILSPKAVLTRRYIRDKENVFGFMSGIALLNEIGLTTQVPNVLTIVSNREKTRGRMVKIANQQAYLIKAPCKIDNSNYNTLKLLEAVKLLNADTLNETQINNMSRFIKENSITINDISQYCIYYPDYVSKRILGGKLIGLLA